MTFIDKVKAQAQALNQTVILVENEDERVLQAAVTATQEKLAKIILIGTKEESQAVCPDLDYTGIEFINPADYPDLDQFAQQYYEMRKHKGVDLEKAQATVRDKTAFGMMLMKNDQADGLVSGAAHSTADTLRPALQILKTKAGTKLVSAFFVMDTQFKDLGSDGIFVFADCGLNENPDADQLSEIALASADSFRFFTGQEPVVAMLSYSSFGSAHSELTEKVVEATKLAKEKAPELRLDGEAQVDTALVPATSERKAPGNKIGGQANVLVFPDLNAGNIGYKLVQYLGGAKAYGPLLQGIAKPVNDLSRGCSTEDIIGVIALTAVQAAGGKNK